MAGMTSERSGARRRIAILVAAAVVSLGSCDPLDLKNYITAKTFGILYVNGSSGSDSNPGTSDKPMKSITTAIDYLKRNVVHGKVYVAAGTYSYDYYAGSFLQVAEGISIYGGYSADFSERDVAAYETQIVDTSTESGTDWTKPNRAIDVPAGVTTVTVIDGFTIRGGGGDYAAAVYCDNGSPTISNNRILGGNAATETSGIFCMQADPRIVDNREINGGTAGSWAAIAVYSYQGAEPTIENNYIFGGAGPRTAGVVSQSGTAPRVDANTIHGGDGTIQGDAIQDNGSSAEIWNNVISGGANGNYSSGIACYYAGNAQIYNNTISGGGGAIAAYGIYLSDSGGATPTPWIRNNLLFTSGGGYGIYETHTDTGTPQAIERNAFWDNGGTTILYRRIISGTPTDYDTAAAINGLSWAEYNNSDIPVFVDLAGSDNDIDTLSDNNWHLAAGTPSSITTGGMDLVLLFNYDRDGKLRTGTGSTGFSMGAYEY